MGLLACALSQSTIFAPIPVQALDDDDGVAAVLALEELLDPPLLLPHPAGARTPTAIAVQAVACRRTLIFRPWPITPARVHPAHREKRARVGRAR